MIIGVTGTMGAGKGTILEYLESIGFEYLSTSNELRAEAASRGIELTRENLQNLGRDMRNKEGGEFLAKKVLSKMAKGKDYIVDGIRNPAEINELRKKEWFFLVSVDAPARLRFSRLSARNRERDPKTWDEFLKFEEIDNKSQDPNGQQNHECMALADFAVYNDGDIGSVSEKIKEIVEHIKLMDKPGQIQESKELL